MSDEFAIANYDPLPTKAELSILAAWWETQSVVKAAQMLGIGEQTAKNQLATVRRKARAESNEAAVAAFWKMIGRQRAVTGSRLGYRTLRYQFDPEYRERVKRMSRDGMRKIRNNDANVVRQQHDRLVAANGNRCSICGVEPTTRRLAVDHDHACCSGSVGCDNCVRGLLCGSCNLMLGNAKDDPTRLEAGIA